MKQWRNLKMANWWNIIWKAAKNIVRKVKNNEDDDDIFFDAFVRKYRDEVRIGNKNNFHNFPFYGKRKTTFLKPGNSSLENYLCAIHNHLWIQVIHLKFWKMQWHLLNFFVSKLELFHEKWESTTPSKNHAVFFRRLPQCNHWSLNINKWFKFAKKK